MKLPPRVYTPHEILARWELRAMLYGPANKQNGTGPPNPRRGGLHAGRSSAALRRLRILRGAVERGSFAKGAREGTLPTVQPSPVPGKAERTRREVAERIRRVDELHARALAENRGRR